MHPDIYRDNKWALRILALAGLGLIVWGAYKQNGTLIFGGIAAFIVCGYFWRAKKRTNIQIDEHGRPTLSGDLDDFRPDPEDPDGAKTEPPPAPGGRERQ